jgi:hypothetical protein
LLKNGHLLRCAATLPGSSPGQACSTYFYIRLAIRLLRALHLAIFEQPVQQRVFQHPVKDRRFSAEKLRRIFN